MEWGGKSTARRENQPTLKGNNFKIKQETQEQQEPGSGQFSSRNCLFPASQMIKNLWTTSCLMTSPQPQLVTTWLNDIKTRMAHLLQGPTVPFICLKLYPHIDSRRLFPNMADFFHPDAWIIPFERRSTAMLKEARKKSWMASQLGQNPASTTEFHENPLCSSGLHLLTNQQTYKWNRVKSN